MSDDVPEAPHESRVSRWDRPPEPHDWRWVLGIVGRTLVSVGVLLFAFVGYQLWGTGIQTAREQNRLRSEFDELLETTVPITSGAPTTTIDIPTTEVPNSNVPSTTLTPEVIAPPAAVDPPVEGDPVARLAIERMGIENKIVVEGVSPADLQDGPGHFPETPLPGQLGNAAIAGHRTTHGQPFNRIDELVPGDDIVVTTVAGRYIYVVSGTRIVAPTDYELVIPTVDPTTATLTLTSCHPEFSATKRIVVLATLDVERSSPVTLPSEPGERDASTLPAEPTTSEPVVTDPGTTEPTTSAEVVVTDETITTDPADTVADPPTSSEEVFQNRWFSDPDAFPQVALWGVALIAASLGAYAVSRATRRNWVGALVGIVPFVVVLYFWFENVNRLLPPNL